MSLAADPEMRVLVQRILHTLVDRHRNQEKLSKPTYVMPFFLPCVCLNNIEASYELIFI